MAIGDGDYVAAENQGYEESILVKNSSKYWFGRGLFSMGEFRCHIYSMKRDERSITVYQDSF
jgi:hypothetical protein